MPVFALVKPNFYAQALTFTRNPDFGANKKILAQNPKTKPAGAKLYQHQQAVSGAKGIRTPDLFHAMEARYQLRHSPVFSSSRLRPVKHSGTPADS